MLATTPYFYFGAQYANMDMLVAACIGCTVLLAAEVVCVAVALGLIRALAADRGVRRDERLISAIAIVGRSMILLLFGHLSMVTARVPAAPYTMVIGALTAIVLAQTAVMARRGPLTRRTAAELALQPAERHLVTGAK